MATGATATGGRRACRPGHRCVGLDANAAGSVSAAAGRRALAGRGRRRPSDARSPGRRVHAAAGARGGDDDRGVRVRATAARARVAAAWAAAGRAEASARELLTRSGRARLAFRGPAFVPPPDENVLQVTSHWKVVLVGGKRTRTAAAIIVAATGIVLGFALVEGLGVFGNDKVSTPIVASSTKPVSTPTRTATEPTIPRPARVPPPSETLAPGDTGSQVRSCSGRLRHSAFGRQARWDYGPATQSAVERFQASEGLPQVGVVGPQTLAALQHALSRRPR